MWKPTWKIRLATYLVAALVLYSMFGCRSIHERDLFYPRRVPRPAATEEGNYLRLVAGDGGELGGLWVQQAGAERMLFYFYGNGETVSDSRIRMAWLARTLDSDVICIDYRGYGYSDGRPGVDALLEDALVIHDHCREQEAGADKRVYVYGRSIGTIPALQLAGEREIDGLVLEAPFTTATDVIRAWNRNLPGVWKYVVRLRPDRQLANREPQPIDILRRYEGPLLIIHGTVDTVIPQSLGRAMFDASPASGKTWCSVEDAGHNDLSLNLPEVEEALRAFFPGPSAPGK